MTGEKLVSAWEEVYDEETGETYFYNNDTGETSWTQPMEENYTDEVQEDEVHYS